MTSSAIPNASELATPGTGASHRQPDSAHMTAFWALVVGAMAIGASPIFVRLSELGPFATAFWRVALALPVLALWSTWERKHSDHGHRVSWRTDGRALLLAGLLFAGDLTFWHLSIHHTSVANATLLANLSPVIVTVGAWALLGERMSPGFLLAMALSMAGAAVLLGDSLAFEPSHALGDSYGIITAFFFGSYVLSVRAVRHRLSAAQIMLWSGLVTTLALLAVALIAGERIVPRTTDGWLVLIGLAVLCHAGGQGLLAFALGHLPASLSSLVILLEPVAAALLGYFILAETLSPLQGLGGAIVLLGVVWAERTVRARRPVPEKPLT